MIQLGADVKAKDKYGWTALHILCQTYQKDNLTEVIRLLIQYGADVKAKTYGGDNAHALLRNNNKNRYNNEVVKLLS